MNSIRLFAALLSLLLLAGCSMMPFRTSQEQREAEAEAEALRQEAQAQGDPFAALEGDFTLHRVLTNSAGAQLATYEVAFPKFSEDGEKARSFSRINSYYQNEITGLVQDAYSFFNQVKEAYGGEWDTVTQPDKPYSVRIGYSLLEAPPGYLSVRCDFRVEENGQVDGYSQAQVFLLDNGWRLDLETLLGDKYETVAPQLLTGILSWCDSNGIEVTGGDTRTLEDFSDNYALSTDGFLFYTEPFHLNNKNPNRYSIPVILGGFHSLLED